MSTTRDDLAYILSLPAGRRALWHLLGKTKLFQQPAVPGDRDLTFLNAGMLNVGLDIWADLQETSPEHVAIMQKEAADHANRIAAQRAGDTSTGDDTGSDLFGSTSPWDRITRTSGE